MKKHHFNGELTKRLFIALLKEQGIEVTPEYKFHDKRRWRFDYAIISKKIAIEIEGGIYTQGRHTRGKGYKSDMEKYNEAVKLGWRLLRYVPAEILNNKTITEIKNLMEN